jgi:CHAT domain-containing protein/tetratricopeptide (TPR) repeat protein
MKDVPSSTYRLSYVLLFVTCMTTGSRSYAQVQPGAVVERVVKNSEAEKAGVQPGDVLLRWSRGDIKGEVESPFDMTAVEVEQAPQGIVSVEGLRGHEKYTWKFGQSLWGVRTRPDIPQDLLITYQQGEELAKANNPEEIAKHWRKLAEQARQSPSYPRWLAAWLLCHGAENLLNAQHWKEGDALYQEAVVQSPPGTPLLHILLGWGDSYQRRGDIVQAEKCYSQHLEESRKLGTQTLMFSAALNNLANMYTIHDDLAKAQEYYDQALVIRQKLAPGSLLVASSLTNRGNLEKERGDLSSAKRDYVESLAIKEKLAPDSLLLTNTLNNLGIVAEERGDLAESEEYHQRALAIRQKLAPESRLFSSSLTNLGIIHLLRGDLVGAEERIRHALAIDKKLAPESLAVAGDISWLAEIAQDRGDSDTAEEYYRQALAIQRKLSPDGLEAAESLTGLGVAAQHRHDFEKTEEYYNEALAITNKIAPDSLDVATILSNLGVVAWQRHDLTKAEERYEEAWKIAQQKAPEGIIASACLHNIADIAQRRSDLAKAEDFERRALALREKLAPGSTIHAESLAAFAEIMRRKKQPQDATKFYEQALAALESQVAHLGSGEETRSGFRAQHADAYKNYIDFLIAEGKPGEAFYVLERMRARSLLETLAAARVDIRKGIDAGLAGRERELQELINAKSERRMRLLGEKHSDEQLALFDKELKQLLHEYKDVEEQIRASSPSYAALTQPQALNANEVQQQLLDPDTVLLEYSLGEERSYAFAITSASLNAYELPKSSDIESTARNVYRLLATWKRAAKSETGPQRRAQLAAQEKEYALAAAELSRMILGPVAGQLQHKRLLIVSDGALQYVPFATLPAPSSLPSRAGVPLVTRYEIVNLPSASVLGELRREETSRKEPSKTVAVLADPVFTAEDDRVALLAKSMPPHNPLDSVLPPATPTAHNAQPAPIPEVQSDVDRSAREIEAQEGGMFPRLPFTRREADAIQAIATPGKVTEELDFDASKTTALSPQLKDYRIIHFATHGMLNNDHPELSGLVFSLVDQHGQSQDGFLRMMDIYNMDLNADLVVLSACQTALGKEIGEEGLIGLTRGFMYAGAPRVVASLWKVDDEATAALMKKFYEGMLREQQTPAQGLRAAQQWMRAQKPWQSPYYWAGFVLQGEWK